MTEEYKYQNEKTTESTEKEQEKSTGKKSKKRGKSKTKELEELLSIASEENNRLKETLLRKLADFENYKKRKDKEFANLSYYVSSEFCKELLPILDQLELSLETSKEKKNFESFYEGISLIYNNFLEILEKKGLKPFKSVGEEFDFEKHEAVLQKEKDEQPSNIVIEEYQKGYIFNDRILRHAKVVVSK